MLIVSITLLVSLVFSKVSIFNYNISFHWACYIIFFDIIMIIIIFVFYNDRRACTFHNFNVDGEVG